MESRMERDGKEKGEMKRLIDAEAQADPVFGQWIPASNPPEDCEDVIVCVSGRFNANILYDHGVEACDCRYENGTWYVCGVKAENMTIHAWMPLPEPPEEESRKMIIGGKEVDRIEVFHGAEKVAVITDDKKTGAPGYRIEFKAGKTTTVKKCSDMDDAEFAEAAGMAQCYKGICEEDALEKKKQQELASLKAELKQKIEEARAKAKADAEKAKEKETQDAVEVAKREAYVEAELKQKIAEARTKAKADAEKEKRRLVAELEEAKAESRRLEKTADPQVAAFKVRADALQESFNKCLGCIDDEPDGVPKKRCGLTREEMEKMIATLSDWKEK